MLETLFESPYTLQRHLNSSLLESRLCYLNHCAERGASKNYLRQLAYNMLKVIDCLQLDRKEDQIDITEIESAANAWINRHPRPSHIKPAQRAKEVFISVATNWLRYIGRLRLPQQSILPYSSMIDEFLTYLLNDRGFSKTSMPGLRSWIGEFLQRLYSQKWPLNELTIAEIQDIIASKGNAGCARITIRKYANSLRLFLRYAEMRGWCKAGLAAAITSPSVYKDTSLPLGPSWETVQHLIANIGENKPIDIRDRAIIMLIAVYGLRGIEVCNLRIEDIDCPFSKMAQH